MSSVTRAASFDLENDCELDHEEIYFEAQPRFQLTDDSLVDPALHAHIANLVETITRIGGEVCRLRAEVDGLLEQNAQLVDSFGKLKDVIVEKGSLDLDDFELACEVMQNSQGPDMSPALISKKIAH